MVKAFEQVTLFSPSGKLIVALYDMDLLSCPWSFNRDFQRLVTGTSLQSELIV